MTNNPDLQPTVTEARDYSPEERALLDSLGGYQKVFNAIGDATSVYAGQPGAGVSASVWKFIKSIFPHVSQDTARSADVGREEAMRKILRDGLSNAAASAPGWRIKILSEAINAALTAPPADDGGG